MRWNFTHFIPSNHEKIKTTTKYSTREELGDRWWSDERAQRVHNSIVLHCSFVSSPPFHYSLLFFLLVARVQYSRDVSAFCCWNTLEVVIFHFFTRKTSISIISFNNFYLHCARPERGELLLLLDDEWVWWSAADWRMSRSYLWYTSRGILSSLGWSARRILILNWIKESEHKREIKNE